MPEVLARRGLRTALAVAGVACVLVVLMVVAAVMIGERPSPQPTGSPLPSQGPSDNGGASTPPSAVEPPVRAEESAPLTVPESVRVASGTFTAEKGVTYLLRFEVSTEKPAESPGSAMYLAISLNCVSIDGDDGGSVGGTENLLPEEPVTYVNQMLLEPPSDGVYSCNISASNPYEHVAALGTTVDLVASWEVTVLEGPAAEAPAEDRLPMTVTAGARSVAFEDEVPVDDFPERDLDILSSLHVTTCTGVNGSREAGRAWCGMGDIDENGSDFDIEIHLDVVGADGAVCDGVEVWTRSVVLERDRHHQLISADETIEVPEDPCGDSLKVRVVIENRGPASLVVHGSNSSLVTVEARKDG